MADTGTLFLDEIEIPFALPSLLDLDVSPHEKGAFTGAIAQKVGRFGRKVRFL